MRLLRGVRNEELKQGNLRHYLLYVLGEIGLVMVGILLALQVNTWNQQRLEKGRETKLLQDLVEEFALNRQRIADMQTLRTAVVPNYEAYLSALATGTANYNDFSEFHGTRYVIGLTNPSKGVVDAMLSAGELTLISNDTLKYLLSDWNDRLINLSENEQILWDVTMEYNASFHQLVLEPRQTWQDWDATRLEQSFRELQQQVIYRNKLVAFGGCVHVVIAEGEAVLAANDEVLQLLQRELLKRST